MMFNRLNNLLFGSLRKQLMVGMVLVISLMMGLFVWGMISRQQDEEIKSHTLQVSALAESTATSSAVWVASRDYSGLQEIVLGIAHYPQLNYIIVLDLHGQVLAHNDSSKIGLYLTDMPQKNEQTVVNRTSNLVEAISPISLSGQQVGWVRLGINRGHFQEEIALIRRDGLVLTLIGIVLSVLAAFFAGRILTRRLSAIQQVADRVEAGQSLARVALVGEDEAARLAKQFNRMLDSLSQREVAIKESEERFRSIFEHSSSVMLLIDPSSGKIVEGNAAAISYYGYAREHLTSLTINEINTLPAEQVAEERQRALHEERNYFIFQHRLALGEIRDVEVYSTPIESGGRRLLFSIVHDVTQRKLAEIALRKSEGKLNAVLQTMVDGLVTIDTAGVITFANQAAQNILSISKEAISGKYFQSQEFRQVGENGAPFPQEQLPLAIALREQREVSNVVHAIVTPDNKFKWLSVNAAPLFDEDGNLAGGIATFIDITERKKTEEEIRANEERMRIFFDNVPLGIFSSTREGKLVYVNPALPKMLGYESQEDLVEVVNRTSVAETLYVDPPLRQELMQELDKDYSHWKTIENRYFCKDGQIIDAIVSIGERQDSITGETIFDGIVTDITERKKLEEVQNFLAKTTSVHLGESFLKIWLAICRRVWACSMSVLIVSKAMV